MRRILSPLLALAVLGPVAAALAAAPDRGLQAVSRDSSNAEPGALAARRARHQAILRGEGGRRKLAALRRAAEGRRADGRGSQAAGRSTASRGDPANVPAGLQAIAACESGGDPHAVGGGGQFRGKYQFTRETWASVGGSGDPAAAPEAEQDRRAAMLYARGGQGSWPVCGG
jgi:Transglycosylase-like domain